MIASNETFVIAAYALTWVVLLGYLARLLARDGRVRGDRARAAAPGGDPR